MPTPTPPPCSTPAARTPVTIVGGGLAGLTAAFELTARGVPVDLFESSDRLGGKAGSDRLPAWLDGSLVPGSGPLPGGVASDHGYHIFPKWYVNLRALWGRVGIDAGTAVFEGGNYLEIPRARDGVRAPFRPEPTLGRQELLAVLDLVLQSDEAVEGITLQSFLKSRPWFAYRPRSPLNDLVLNALTIGDPDLSARAVRNVFRQWLPVFFERNWDALRDSLDAGFIEPLAQAIRDSGLGHVHLHHRLGTLARNGDGTISAVIHRPDGSVEHRDGPLILALPLEVLRALDGPELFRAGAPLSRLHRLNANPFSALDVFFADRLPGMPLEHFTLVGSEYGLTAFDIGQHWPALQAGPGTVLQFVASRSRRFLSLTDAAFVEVLRDHIAQWIPEIARPGRVAAFVPHRNAGTPLFINEVGKWEDRLPTWDGALPNVWFAGDHVRNTTDIASMEGAVRSGLDAAEAVRRTVALTTAPVPILPPVDLPPWTRLLEGSGEALTGRLVELLGSIGARS
jgi:hypothetical protein